MLLWFAIVMCLTTAVVAVIRSMVLLVTVTGSSMLPELSMGDRALAFRWPRKWLRRGQVVLVRGLAGYDGFTVKRVIGLPGDFFAETDDHRFEIVPTKGKLGGLHRSLVPDRALFLKGDAPNSVDSTTLGPVRVGALVAIAVRHLGGQQGNRHVPIR